MAIEIAESILFRALSRHDPTSTVIVDLASGNEFSYDTLLRDALHVKNALAQRLGRDVHCGERIAFIVKNGYTFVVTLLAIFACNAIAVPLALSLPASELRHVLNTSQAGVLLSSTEYAAKAEDTTAEGLDSPPSSFEVESLLAGSDQFSASGSRVPCTTHAGMMLFTSGTTAKPKGVMLSDATLAAQAQSLVAAWNYTPSDRLLHVLPLHHIHGTVNAILAPLLAGSTIEFMYPFQGDEVWKRLAAPFVDQETGKDTSTMTRPPITLFTAVPTIWSRMLDTYASLSPALQRAGKKAVSREYLRLNMSGSAALPKSISDGWNELSGNNKLLERYGMTEVGMALSCGLQDQDRIEGSVGWPLPGVKVRLVEYDDDTGVSTVVKLGAEIDPSSGMERQGEIQLRGPTIFKGYWRDPAATAKEFTDDGWFKTGDIAVRRPVTGSGQGDSGLWAQGPAYFVQGRKSADIIKTGGEKVSALQIEREILSLPEVSEVAVLGLPSQTWGQKVVAVVVLKSECLRNGKSWGLLELRRDLRSRLVGYKIPQDIEIVETIRRNAMGKINKKELMTAVFGDIEQIRRRSVDLTALKKTTK